MDDNIRLLKNDKAYNTLFVAMNDTYKLDLYGVEVHKGIVYKISKATYLRGWEKRHQYLKYKDVIKLEYFIAKKIKNKIIGDVRLFVLNNIKRYDFYNKESIPEICHSLHWDLVEECIESLLWDGFYNNLDYSEINNNILKLGNLSFNLYTNEIIFWKNDKKINTLDYFFTNEQKNILIAQEQHKKNALPQEAKQYLMMNRFN